jgi:cytoskeletal protein CcmA (bactofilin family)
MKKIIYLLAFSFLFFIPSISQAYVIKSADFIYVAKDEVIEGNLYFSSKSINIEGQVLGDVIGVAPNIQINGQIKGDLISISQNLIINGQIDGNLRTISSVNNINGSVGKNINFLGESIILGKDSFVGQDLLIKTIGLESNGKIEGSIHGGAYNSLINGQIEKNINLVTDNIKRKKYSSSLEFGDSAVVGGNLEYKSGNLAKLKNETIKGKITHKFPEKQNQSKNKINKTLYLILSSFLIALILNKLFKNKIDKLKKIIIEKKQNLILPGSIILLLGPITFFLIAITIIGFPVALIGLIFWFLAIFLSRILIAVLLGDYIFKLVKKENISIYLKILTGITITFLFFSLPFIGWFFSLISIITGLGAFYFIIRKN